MFDYFCNEPYKIPNCPYIDEFCSFSPKSKNDHQDFAVTMFNNKYRLSQIDLYYIVILDCKMVEMADNIYNRVVHVGFSLSRKRIESIYECHHHISYILIAPPHFTPIQTAHNSKIADVIFIIHQNKTAVQNSQYTSAGQVHRLKQY